MADSGVDAADSSTDAGTDGGDGGGDAASDGPIDVAADVGGESCSVADATVMTRCLGVASDTLGHWPFDTVTTGTTPDVGPQNIAGTVTGATLTTGQVGQALSFDGSSYVTMDSTNLRPVHAVSITAWVRPSSLPGSWRVIAGVGGNGNNNNPYGLTYFNSQLQWYTSDQTGNPFLADPNDYSGHVGTWHHVAATYERCTQRTTIYVDGVLTAQANTAPPMLVYEGAPFRVGADTDGGVPALHFLGDIDEVKIFGCELSSGQVATDFTTNSPFP